MSRTLAHLRYWQAVLLLEQAMTISIPAMPSVANTATAGGTSNDQKLKKNQNYKNIL